jgi:hypothetical protein
MRSIFVHYPMEDEPKIRAWLDAHASPHSDGSWSSPTLQDARLYIQLATSLDLEPDWEPAEISAIADEVGPRTGLVHVDVSGRIRGDEEVRVICAALLGLSPRSRAQDEYTPHLWTADEISSGALAEGHPFFDYDGWYEAYKRTRCEPGAG